jgi:hypothetical protein
MMVSLEGTRYRNSGLRLDASISRESEHPGGFKRRKALLRRTAEDCSLSQLSALANASITVRNVVLTHKDVKNEGRSDYPYENKKYGDKITDNIVDFLAETSQSMR